MHPKIAIECHPARGDEAEHGAQTSDDSRTRTAIHTDPLLASILATAAALRKGHYLEAERLREKSRESFNKNKKKIGMKSCWNCGSMDHLKRECPTR